MKSRFFTRFAMIATLVAALGSTAHAVESSHLRANISFPFKAFSADMPSGHYEFAISSNSGVPVFTMRSDSGKTAMVVGQYMVSSRKNLRPRLTFTCAGDNCGLTEVWSPGGTGWATTSPKLNSSDKERLVTVYMDRAAGE